MMQRLPILFVFMVFATSASQARAAWNLEPLTVQKGYFRDHGDCADLRTEYYDACQCEADIVVPQIRGGADKAGQARLNDLLKSREKSLELCDGKKVATPPDKKKDFLPHARANEHVSQTILSYSIPFESDRLIEILQHDYDNFGSADGGMYGNSYTLIDKDTLQEIQPARAFAPSALPAVNKAILDALAASDSRDMIEPDIFANPPQFITEAGCVDRDKRFADRDCQFYLAQDGWHIAFGEMTIAAHAAGIIDIPFTRPDLFTDPRLRAPAPNQVPQPRPHLGVAHVSG